MTYLEMCEKLRGAGVENPEWDTALLIERFCGVNASTVPLFGDRDYPNAQLEHAVSRRCARYPLQYLLGEWQFYRQTYEVSPHCLIPRSDTEILVEEAVRGLPQGARFADLCTGSGCIAVSVLAERPDTRAVAVEKFPETLALAERNAQKNGVRTRFAPICADVLAQDCLADAGLFDAILSNPPYITEREMETLAPELRAEPREALEGGCDGLIFYRHIIAQYASRLTENGFFLFEIGCDQAEAVQEIGRAAGLKNARVIRDLGGNDRVVYLEK